MKLWERTKSFWGAASLIVAMIIVGATAQAYLNEYQKDVAKNVRDIAANIEKIAENVKDIELAGMSMKQVYEEIKAGRKDARMYRKKRRLDDFYAKYGEANCRKERERHVKELCRDLEREVIPWLSRKIR